MGPVGFGAISLAGQEEEVLVEFMGTLKGLTFWQEKRGAMVSSPTLGGKSSCSILEYGRSASLGQREKEREGVLGLKSDVLGSGQAGPQIHVPYSVCAAGPCHFD